jgi:hypothetical protein
MGQSVSPVTSRAGHAQLWEFGQATSHASIYYNDNIKINRLVTKLIQLFFIFGLSCDFNFWRYFWGNNSLRLTPRSYNVNSRSILKQANPFAKYYNINRMVRSQFHVEDRTSCSRFSSVRLDNSGYFDALRSDNRPYVATTNFVADDIFFTKVAILTYRSWTLCNWTFFRPMPQGGLPTSALFDLMSPRAAEGASSWYAQFLGLENKFTLQTAAIRWGGSLNYRGRGTRKGELRRLSGYLRSHSTYNTGLGTPTHSRALLYL